LRKTNVQTKSKIEETKSLQEFRRLSLRFKNLDEPRRPGDEKRQRRTGAYADDAFLPKDDADRQILGPASKKLPPAGGSSFDAQIRMSRGMPEAEIAAGPVARERRDRRTRMYAEDDLRRGAQSSPNLDVT
jgi:hypothetical protein